MNTKEELRSKLEIVLEQAKTGKIEATQDGICFVLDCLDWDYSETDLFEDIYQTWPKYSGCFAFPIGGEEEFIKFNLWTGKSLALRIELLEYCIAELEK